MTVFRELSPLQQTILNNKLYENKLDSKNIQNVQKTYSKSPNLKPKQGGEVKTINLKVFKEHPTSRFFINSSKMSNVQAFFNTKDTFFKPKIKPIFSSSIIDHSKSNNMKDSSTDINSQRSQNNISNRTGYNSFRMLSPQHQNYLDNQPISSSTLMNIKQNLKSPLEYRSGGVNRKFYKSQTKKLNRSPFTSLQAREIK
jgi:hypothetical protein